jgi:Holliday junction resolvasome RuvABC endonuclease subunit
LSTVIIGVDLGTKWGYCTWDSELGYFDSGYHKLPTDFVEKFRKLVREMLQREKPNYVFYEGVFHHTGVYAGHKYGYYKNMLVSECDLAGIPCVSVGVQQAKKAITGSGSASKHFVMEKASELMKKIIISTDEADAVGICKFGVDCYQKGILNKLKKENKKWQK